jgi:hypothetical protein
MIGFVYVSDIPKLIITIVIGIILLLIWGSALVYFFPTGGVAAGRLALVGILGTIAFSWWAGTAIWEEIDTRLYWRKLQGTKSRKLIGNIQYTPPSGAFYACPRCQNANPRGSRFCSACGGSIASSPISQSAFEHKPEFITPKQTKMYNYTIITDHKEADKLFRFGQIYYHGQGVPRIFAEAASYYRKSAELGNSKAQLNLGALYENGEGVARDHKEACFWMALSYAYDKQQFDLSDMGLSAKDLSDLRIRISKWFAEH